MNENKEVLRTIDMTPNWEETVQMLVALIERRRCRRSGATAILRKCKRRPRLARHRLYRDRRSSPSRCAFPQGR
ncbi:hypothetical protein RHI9324_05442 [Rhizobium sp. CECT 9324]|nr:hypothetical protein RHI9324_05442 [Rhizobium sp. CECT 9324]